MHVHCTYNDNIIFIKQASACVYPTTFELTTVIVGMRAGGLGGID